jgi:patatin-like phospholipase/acyl hydrolase
MNPYRILSLDGGGIRGLITAVWLAELEKQLKKPIHHFFELMAGTSTGSILASALALGIPAQKIVDLYREKGSTIFPSTGSRLWSRVTRVFADGVSAPKYDPAGLESCLQEVFGKKTLGSLKVPTLIFSYNVFTREPVAFKSYRENFEKLLVWEVVRASCSAPTYFPSKELKVGQSTQPYIDGGVAANNPSACAVAEGIAINSKEKKADRIPLDNFVLASFGTGSSTRPISSEDSQEWGALEWAVPIIDVLFDGSTDTSDYVARQIVADDNYFRFQIPLDKAYDDMDRADEVNLNALIGAAESYLNSNDGASLIKKLVQKLATKN